MLPHALSSEACSLAPGVERLAVTAEIELGPGAEPRSTRFYRSRIRSDARLDYDQLDAIFAGRAAAPPEVAEPLAAARDVAAELGEHRGTTSLDVESFEPEFRFDAAGDVVAAHGVAQTESHRLIERLMILTNEQVAETAGAPEGAGDLPRPRPARPGPDRAPGRAAGGARGADAGAGPGPLRRSRRAKSPPRRAGSPAARPRGAATGARRIHRSCSVPSSRPTTASATAATPASAAPPTRTSPRRSAATRTWSCTGRCWRRWGRGSGRRAWPRRATSPPTAPTASASRRRSSATPTTSAPPSCSNASWSSAAPRRSSRARSPG